MTPAAPDLPMPASALLPHSGDIVLLDDIVSCDDETLAASATVRPGLFSLADGSLPPWAGLEILAQAVAAWSGRQSLLAGQPARMGFLLGTRHYECRVDAFAPGAALTVQVTRALQDDSGMGIFEGRILQDGREIAHARLNVYQPGDISSYTQEIEPA
ncbi:MAG: ApeP family dehydratase [Bordetella sp.]|uniref:ApeP family dehydratase n=1 Tax=Bordetella sp. TaxID=28081 RepID=UPI003F7B7972